MDAPTIGHGKLSGSSGHTLAGNFEIRAADGGSLLIVDEAFSFDGAPAPWWGFGRSGRLAEGTLFAALKAKTGSQRFAIPSTLDLNQYDTLILWCRDFAILLGTGQILNS